MFDVFIVDKITRRVTRVVGFSLDAARAEEREGWGLAMADLTREFVVKVPAGAIDFRTGGYYKG